MYKLSYPGPVHSCQGRLQEGGVAALPVMGLPSHWRLKGDLPSLTPPHSQTSAAQFLPQTLAAQSLPQRDCLSCSCFKSFMKDSPYVPGSSQTMEMGTKSNIRPGRDKLFYVPSGHPKDQWSGLEGSPGPRCPHPMPSLHPPRALKLMPTIHSLLYTTVATYCF